MFQSGSQRLEAKEGFISWNSFSRNVLLEMAQRIDAHREELARLECLMGKPIRQARGDMDASVECLKYFAGYADKIHGKVIMMDPNFKTLTMREPLGICSIIISFNYPLRTCL